MSKIAPLQQKYRLADHVRACHVDGQVILLDLERDKYIGVGGSLISALSCRIVDWPLVGSPACDAAKTADVDHWVATMNGQGILATASALASGRAVVAEPQQSLLACDTPPWGGFQWRRIINIAGANITSGRWLKRHRLTEIADRIGCLRQALPTTGADPSRLQSAVTWYLRTRPFVMTSHDQCLRDSLTLLHFLASERLYPQWVIGVRTRPFAAHSWVQQGPMVLNDLHENVRRYTPIFVI